jgi:hypothetical protein
VAELSVSEMQDFRVNEESPQKRGSGSSNNPSVRFVAHVEEQMTPGFDSDKIDRNFKNALQDNNL